MPYNGPGARHTAVATKQCDHGQVVVEDNIVGVAFKTQGLTRYQDPAGTPLRISSGETFDIQVGGIIESPASGPLASVGKDDLVYITVASNALALSAGAGKIPVGVVSELDSTRTPAVARINTNAWQAFLPGA